MSPASRPGSQRLPAPRSDACETARAVYRAIAAGELADALRLVDPHILVVEHPPLADAVPLRGHAGLARLLRIYADAFAVNHLVVADVTAGRHDSALVELGLERAAGRRAITVFHVAWCTRGKVQRIEVFRERVAAAAATGG